MITAKQKRLIGRSDNEVVYDIYFSMKVVQKYQPIKRLTHLTYVASPFGPKDPLLKLALYALPKIYDSIKVFPN